MYRTLCVMALVALCAGLAHSFSWDIVVGVSNRLEFINNYNGRPTHTEKMTWNDTIYHTTYDPVHDRVLFAQSSNIFSFDITTKKTECLWRDINKNTITNLAYDPATELLFWVESYENIYSISLKQELQMYYDSKVFKKSLILKEEAYDLAIESCRGFIYWKENSRVHRVRFNGSESELLFDGNYVNTLTIDPYSQKMYFFEDTGSIKSADLDGKNIRTIIRSTRSIDHLIVSKDFIYCSYYHNEDKKYCILQIPKNLPRGINMKPKILFQDEDVRSMAANYNIENVTRENQDCDTLKSLLPNNSVSTNVSMRNVHGTKDSGESRCECTQGYSGERCDVCHNYCLHGDCSASAEGQPKCSCYAGYTGERCEVDVCQGYCLHDGICSLSEENKPLCGCSDYYTGKRCDVPVLQIKCAISILKDILNTDVTSDKGMTWRCSSTAV